MSSTLAIGATECHDYVYTVQQGDPNPLCNTVTVHSDPEGPLTNDITDDDTACVDLVEPCIEITKTPDVTFSKVGDPITYTICITNNGDVNLENIVVTDPMLGGTLSGFPSTLSIRASIRVTIGISVSPCSKTSPGQAAGSSRLLISGPRSA